MGRPTRAGSDPARVEAAPARAEDLKEVPDFSIG